MAVLIGLDAGHGGMDGGGVGLGSTPEKDLNLQIAKKLEKTLTEKNEEIKETLLELIK